MGGGIAQKTKPQMLPRDLQSALECVVDVHWGHNYVPKLRRNVYSIVTGIYSKVYVEISSLGIHLDNPNPNCIYRILLIRAWDQSKDADHETPQWHHTARYVVPKGSELVDERMKKFWCVDLETK